LGYRPGFFFRHKHVQIKYGCRPCDTAGANPQIELAAKPSQPIEESLAAPELLAHVAVSSLTSTCQRHGIKPELYLTQLLVNLPDTPVTQFDPWLPDQWKARQEAQDAKDTPTAGLPVLPTPMLPPAAAP
jgi:hypothetical protein